MMWKKRWQPCCANLWIKGRAYPETDIVSSFTRPYSLSDLCGFTRLYIMKSDSGEKHSIISLFGMCTAVYGMFVFHRRHFLLEFAYQHEGREWSVLGSASFRAELSVVSLLVQFMKFNCHIKQDAELQFWCDCKVEIKWVEPLKKAVCLVKLWMLG